MAAEPDEPGEVDEDDRSTGLYGIGVASRLVGTGAQNLRAYERAGLVQPDRTGGGTRLYSADDLARVRRIQELLEAGLNLAGIAMVLDLEEERRQLRSGTGAPDTGTESADQI